MRLGLGLGLTSLAALIRSGAAKVVGFVFNGATSPVRTQGADGLTSGMALSTATMVHQLFTHDMEPEDGLTSSMAYLSGSMAQQLYDYTVNDPADGLESSMSLVSASMVIP